MPKKIIYLLLTIFIIGGGFFLFKSKEKKLSFTRSQVSIKNIKKTINVDAVITPNTYANISSELPTLIKEVKVKVNDQVKKDDILLVLDEKAIAAQIAKARLAVERAELAERKARRKWDILKPEEKESIKKTTQETREILRELYAQADKTIITSPINGIIVEQNARPGEIAQGIMIRIIDPQSLQLEALIPEVDISKIKIGQSATVTFDAYPNKPLPGRVSSIEIGSQEKQNITYYKTIIKLTNSKNLKILEGMNADVDIEISGKENIPAVSRDFTQKDERGYFVLIKDQKNKQGFSKKYFQPGMIGDKYIEIQSGLNLGEEIVKLKTEQ